MKPGMATVSGDQLRRTKGSAPFDMYEVTVTAWTPSRCWVLRWFTRFGTSMMPSSSIRPWRIHQLVRFLGGWPVQCGGVVGEYGEREGFFLWFGSLKHCVATPWEWNNDWYVFSGMFFFWNVDTTLCSMLNASGKTNQTVLRNHFLKTLDSRQPHRHSAQYVQWISMVYSFGHCPVLFSV